MKSKTYLKALGCAELGLKVFPSYPKSKVLVKGAYEQATTEKDTLAKWWGENESYNVQLVLKDNSLICIDIDDHNEQENGVKEFLELLKNNVTDGEPFPLDTYRESAPTGNGQHIFLRVPSEIFKRKLKNKLCNGVEIKKDFTQIAPSITDKGEYKQVFIKSLNRHLELKDIKNAPTWLIRLLIKDEIQRNNTFTHANHSYNTDETPLNFVIDGLGNKGNRNNLARLTGFIKWQQENKGLKPLVAKELLEQANLRTTPPLSEKEFTQVLKSIYRR